MSFYGSKQNRSAGEGKQSKGNYEKRKGRLKDNRQQHYVMKQVKREGLGEKKISCSSFKKPLGRNIDALYFSVRLKTLRSIYQKEIYVYTYMSKRIISVYILLYVL